MKTSVGNIHKPFLEDKENCVIFMFISKGHISIINNVRNCQDHHHDCRHPQDRDRLERELHELCTLIELSQVAFVIF